MDLPLLSPGGLVPVVLEYRLLPDPETREVGLTLLSPGDSRLLSMRASWAGGDLPLRLLELRPHYWSGTVTLPARVEAQGEGGERGAMRALSPSAGEAVTLRLTYDVDGGWEDAGRVLVPILAVSWLPREPHPRTFVARVEVPSGVTVTESFPTSVVERPVGAGGGSYQVALQGVPSMLVFRMVRGEPPFFTLERILDILVVGALLLMGGLGIRFLKGGGE